MDKSLVVSQDGAVYGIPYVVEGYGIIYNKEIMGRYFALPEKATTVSKVEDINNFETLKAVVEDMTLNKDKLGIEGVFASTSFAAGEDWRWQTHLLNVPVYYEFKEEGITDTNSLKMSFAENYKNIIDLYANNSCTEKTELKTKTGKDYVTNRLGFISPFNTFEDDEIPTDPLAKQVVEYMSDTNLTSVGWNFTAFPNQVFKDEVGQSLLDYLEEKAWDDVIKDLKAGWTREKTGK